MTATKTENAPYPYEALKELHEKGYLPYERCRVTKTIPSNNPNEAAWPPGKVLEIISMPWAAPINAKIAEDVLPDAKDLPILIMARELLGREDDVDAEGDPTTIREIQCNAVEPIPRKKLFK